MSHGANAVTRATQSAAKARLSQAEVWDKVSAIQSGLSGFREQFARLEMALRTHAPSTSILHSGPPSLVTRPPATF